MIINLRLLSLYRWTVDDQDPKSFDSLCMMNTTLQHKQINFPQPKQACTSINYEYLRCQLITEQKNIILIAREVCSVATNAYSEKMELST